MWTFERTRNEIETFVESLLFGDEPRWSV
jgi:hypothetical protein